MGYKVLIGLEMHCEISNTNTKVFSSAKNGYNDMPNTNIRPVDMGFPGTLPVVFSASQRNIKLCIYMVESLCCPPGTIRALLIGYTPIENKS